MNFLKFLPFFAFFVVCVFAAAQPAAEQPAKRQVPNYPAELNTIIDGGSQLLGGETFDQLKSIVSNANDLLTPTFVNNTLTIINDIGPVSSYWTLLL